MAVLHRFYCILILVLIQRRLRQAFIYKQSHQSLYSCLLKQSMDVDEGSENSKSCVKQPLSTRQTIGFQDQLLLNAGQKFCRMLQGGHSAILSTFIKLPFVIKIFVLSIFEWLFYTGLTVYETAHVILVLIKLISGPGSDKQAQLSTVSS